MQWLTEETGWILPEETGLPGQAPDSLPHWEEPERLLRLGAGLSAASQRCMIGYAADAPRARAAALMTAGAAAAAGGNAVLVPDCAAAELSAASAAGDCGIVLHIGENRLRIYGRGLLPLTVQDEKQMQTAFQPDNQPWMRGAEYGAVTDGAALRLLYPAQIAAHLPAELPNRLQFSTASRRLLGVMQQCFRGGSGPEITVQLSEDGRRISLYAASFGWIFYERLLLMVCLHEVAAGRDVALPYWVPHIAEEAARAHHCRILRYASRSDGSDSEARALAREQGFTLDGGILLARLLRIRAESEPDWKRWAESLPAFSTVRRILPAEDAAAAAARCGAYLHTERTPEGIRAKDTRGEALLRPSPSGKSISLLVEARSAEAAAELAGDLAVWMSACTQRSASEGGQ